MKKCNYCKKEIKSYRPKTYKNYFCSNECHINYRKNKIKLKCDYCKKDIEKNFSLVHNTNFCNRECFNKYIINENNNMWKGDKVGYMPLQILSYVFKC